MRVKVKKDQGNLIFFKRNYYCDIYLKLQMNIWYLLTKKYILFTILLERKVVILNKNLINLTPEDILNKEFKVDTRGYRLKEVDQFLDIIITDYQEFNKIILELQKEKEEQLEEILNLKQEIRNLKTSVEISRSASSNSDNISNIDILKRLSQLEKIVYGKDE